MKLNRLLFLLILLSCQGMAQDLPFYDPTRINEIRISFAEPDWKAILDSLYLTQGDSGRLAGDVMINDQEFRKAGIRYKGFSSWNSGEIKNPFNIDLDFINTEQEYQGYAKIKLSNVIHDPSFVREVLAYEIAGKYLPAPEANYARLYINNDFIGLYTNVEAIDKRFVKSKFGDNNRSFFKGEPETLIYPFGQNANLAYSHGLDTSGYLPYYKMESDTGWPRLLNLIRVLNTAPDSLDQFLNTDRALWMHAFNYSILNLDSYIGYAQNYYLYEDVNGRFNPLIWDLNMSFGSFRDSDGSNNFLGVTIPKLKLLDPLQHLKFSISPRPLMKQLFSNDTLKRMYLAHIRTILKENIDNGSYLERTKSLQELILTTVMVDTNKFYSFQDFLTNADSTVGGSGSMIQYPGIRDLMEARSEYLHSYKGISGEPVITSITHIPEIPVKGQTLKFIADASHATEVMLGYRNDRYSPFKRLAMLDDGSRGDLVAGDGFFTADLTINSALIQYYFYAQNDSAGVFLPERAEYEFYTLQTEVQKGELVINEIKPGDEGWVELLNLTNEDLSLKNFSLDTEQEYTTRWYFPEITIESGDFKVITAGQPDLFENMFTMPQKDGAALILRNNHNALIDSVYWYSCPVTRTLGRYPNGNGSFQFMQPSAGKNNYVTSTSQKGFRIYPNPASGSFTLEFIPPGETVGIEIFTSSGICIRKDEFAVPVQSQDAIALSYNCIDVGGLYFVRLTGTGWQETRKLLVF